MLRVLNTLRISFLIELKYRYSKVKRISSLIQTPESGYQCKAVIFCLNLIKNMTLLADLTSSTMTISDLNDYSPLLKESVLKESDLFIIDVYIALNQRRRTKGLQPLSLSNVIFNIIS